MAEIEGNGVGSFQITQNDVFSHTVDLFEPTRQEKSVLRGREVMYRPLSSTSAGPFEFLVASQAGYYKQLGSFRLYGKTRIVAEDGTDIDSNVLDVGIVNMFPASLFRSIEVEVNNHAVSDLGTAASHYKTYIETIITYGADARQGHLDAAMFEMDQANQFDTHANNAAYAKRKARMRDSRVFDWEIPLSSDFLRADRCLPPGNDVTIRLARAPDSFSILSDAGGRYKVDIVELKLYCRLLEMNHAITAYHMDGWKKQPFLYPINRTSVQNWNMPMGRQHDTIGPLFRGHLPKAIIVGMVRSTAFNGAQAENPWNFQHFGCNRISIQVKGISVPAEPYAPNFQAGLFAREYNGLFQQSGIKISNEGNCITRDLFTGGAYLQAFDLTPDNCNGFHQHPPDDGTCYLDIGFSQELEDSITIIVYAVFDAEVHINMDGQAMSRFLQ